MTHDFPAAVLTGVPRERPASPARPHRAADTTGAWRYEGRRRSRAAWFVAVVLSAGAHAGLLLGLGSHRAKPVAPPAEERIIALRLAIPDLKELEEPEPATNENTEVTTSPAVLVPMQADVPQLVRPSDFVQTLNFASMLEQPDFSQLKVYAVPENMRGGGKLAEHIRTVFNLADLDRIPEPVFQPAPQFPTALRREARTATVRVEFIVDTEGRVIEPVVLESTHSGFDEAALAGVSRWKFRAGSKGGRHVNTRMRVPIVFKLLDSVD